MILQNINAFDFEEFFIYEFILTNGTIVLVILLVLTTINHRHQHHQ